jgi:hypothetical protein
MDVVEALLPYRNATKAFLPIFDPEKYFLLENINQRTYITYNEMLLALMCLICQLVFYWLGGPPLQSRLHLFILICSQVSVVIFLFFSRYSTCFVLRNYTFMTMFLW